VQRIRLIGGALVVLTVVTRLPLLVHPGPIDDEVMYSVVADVMVDGGRLYIDAVDRKPPLLFWTYSALFTLAGPHNWLALHFVALLWTLLTMLGLYALARDMFDVETGVAAAALYSVFQPWATPKNLAFNGELMMNLPLVWAWVLAFGRARLRWRLELTAAGALLATAFLLKQPAAIAAVPVGLYVLLPQYRAARGYTWAQSVVHAGWLTVGFVGALGVTAAALYVHGNLSQAVFWTRAANDVPFVFWERGVLHTMAFGAACLPLVVGAALARAGQAFDGRAAERTAVWLLVVASVMGVAAGGRFHPHYYIQLVAPLSIAAAPALVGRVRRFGSGWQLEPAVMRRWVAVMAVGFWLAAWWVLALEPRDTEAGRYLRTHAAPGDRIFVWGQSPRIYLDAQRLPASRFITSFALTGYIFGPGVPGVDTRHRIVPGAWDQFADDMAARPAAFIVEVRSHRAVHYPIEQFPMLSRLLAEHYRAVAHVAEGVIYRRMPELHGGTGRAASR